MIAPFDGDVIFAGSLAVVAVAVFVVPSTRKLSASRPNLPGEFQHNLNMS